MSNGPGSLSENIFRSEVEDEIVFDLDTSFQRESQLEQARKIAPSKRRASTFDFKLPSFLEGIKAPNIEGPNVGAPIDLGVPDIPQVDLTVPNPNFKPAIDAADQALKAGEKVVQPVAEVVSAAVEPVQEQVTEVTKDLSDAAREAIEAVGQPLEGAQVRKGDGTKYGEISVGETGGVIDISQNLDKMISSLTSGTDIEGVQGRDIFQLATDPSSYVKEKGIEESTAFISNSLGIDSGRAADIVSALDNPEAFVESKGIEEATDFIIETTGAGDIFDSESAAALERTTGVSLGSAGTGAIGGGLGALVSGGDVAEVAESAAKGAASAVVVNTTAGMANAIIPGSGLLIKGLATAFNYSCYLSTSAYHHGFIDKKDYLLFTKYRLKIQSKDLLSEPVWLGYISLFEPVYAKLIDDKKMAGYFFNFVTKPWLSYIKFKSGVSGFSFAGFFVTQLLKLACLSSFLFSPLKSMKRKKELRGINLMNVYKSIIRVVEKGRAYA